MYKSILEIPEPEGLQLEKELEKPELGRPLEEWLAPIYFMGTNPQRFARMVRRRAIPTLIEMLKMYRVDFTRNEGGYNFCTHPIEYSDIAVWNLIHEGPNLTASVNWIFSERLYYIHSPVTLYSINMGAKKRGTKYGEGSFCFTSCAHCVTGRIKSLKRSVREAYAQQEDLRTVDVTAYPSALIPLTPWNSIKGKEYRELTALSRALGVRS